MKKLSLLFLLPILFFSCSSDDNEPKQDYTSFVVKNNSSTVELPNVVVGYLKDDKYVKITSLGNIKANDQSKEFVIEDKSITSVYFFADYSGTIKINKEYVIKQNSKNIFTLSGDIKVIEISDKTDPTQYPQ